MHGNKKTTYILQSTFAARSISPTVRIWAFQARDPGSTPGWCTYFLPQLSVSFCLCMDFCQESISTIRSVSWIASWLNFMIILAYKLRNLPLLFRRDLGYSIPGMSPFLSNPQKNHISRNSHSSHKNNCEVKLNAFSNFESLS